MRQSKAKLIRRLLGFSSTSPQTYSVLEKWQYRKTKRLLNTVPGPQRGAFLDEIAPIKARLVEELAKRFPKAATPASAPVETAPPSSTP